jgi:hypothetical protein
MPPLSLAALIEDVERQASSPLERLGAAVSTSAEIHSISDDLVSRFVEDARRGGCSWTEIGGVLGVSKQAAQQRFPSAGAEVWPVGFREDAQRALGAAAEHARRFGHPYLGTEHVLLALAEQTDSLAGHVLADLEITPAAIEQAINELAVRGEPASGPIGVSGRVKRALEHARREGRRLGHRCPGAEHLLLVLSTDDDGAAARILLGLGVTPARLRQTLAARRGPDADEIAARLTRPRRRLHRRRN